MKLYKYAEKAKQSLNAMTLKCVPPPLQHSNICICTTLTVDIWPQKPFQQWQLTWWTFVASFTEIPPPSTKILCYTKKVLLDNGWTEGQTTKKDNTFTAYCWQCRHKKWQKLYGSFVTYRKKNRWTDRQQSQNSNTDAFSYT